MVPPRGTYLYIYTAKSLENLLMEKLAIVHFKLFKYWQMKVLGNKWTPPIRKLSSLEPLTGMHFKLGQGNSTTVCENEVSGIRHGVPPERRNFESHMAPLKQHRFAYIFISHKDITSMCNYFIHM